MENNTAINNIEEAKPMDKKAKALKITVIVINVIFYLFIALLLLFSIANIAGSKKDKVKNIFGFGYAEVLSDSMKPGSAGVEVIDADKAKGYKSSFSKEDIIFVTTLSNKEKQNLKIGDIVTYYDPVFNKGALISHRIVDYVYSSDGSKINAYILQGDCYVGTKYDYSLYTEQKSFLVSDGYAQNISVEQLRAKYVGQWEGAASALNWISNPKKGFILVIILPTLFFLLFEMFMVIKNIMSIKTQKLTANAEEQKELLRSELEAEKEKMKQELLEQLRKEALAEANASNELSEEEMKKEENVEEGSTEGE